MDGEIEGDASSHTTSRMSDRKAKVQIVGRVSGRRIWTVEQKLTIIGEANGRAARDREWAALYVASATSRWGAWRTSRYWTPGRKFSNGAVLRAGAVGVDACCADRGIIAACSDRLQFVRARRRCGQYTPYGIDRPY